MTNPIQKFFSPETLPEAKNVEIPLDFFLMAYKKLCIDFAFLEDPDKFYYWNGPDTIELLREYKADGGKVILVDHQQYNLKIKLLAKL